MLLVKRHQSRGLTKTLDQFTSTTIVVEFKFHKVWWSTIMATWLRPQMNLTCLLSKYQQIKILFRTTWCLLIRTLQWARVSLQSQSKKMLWIHLTNMIKYFNKWGWFFDAERKKINAQTLKLLRNSSLIVNDLIFCCSPPHSLLAFLTLRPSGCLKSWPQLW